MSTDTISEISLPVNFLLIQQYMMHQAISHPLLKDPKSSRGRAKPKLPHPPSHPTRGVGHTRTTPAPVPPRAYRVQMRAWLRTQRTTPPIPLATLTRAAIPSV